MSYFSKIQIKESAGRLKRGIFATTNLTKKEVIYQEKPIAFLQLSFSRLTTLICSECFGIVGTPIQQLQYILDIGKKNIEDISPNISEKLNLPNFDFNFCEIFRCDYGCENVYCSEECKKKSQTKGFHLILCVKSSERQKLMWKQFKAHAMKYNENFILAAKVYADIIYLTKYKKTSFEEAVSIFCNFHQKEWFELKNYAKVPTKYSEEIQSREKRILRLSESIKLLKEFFTLSVCEKQEKAEFLVKNNNWDYFFSLKFYANLLGQFDLVNANIEYETPLSKIFNYYRETRPDDFIEHFLPVCKVLKEIFIISSLEVDKSSINNIDLDSIIPPVMGIGLFSHISLTNHSCIPNCEIIYPLGNFTAQVCAIYDIKKGEELNLSYIEENLNIGERQLILKQDYDFICACCRCRVEAAKEILTRKNVLPSKPDELQAKLSEITGMETNVIKKVISFNKNIKQSEEDTIRIVH